MSRPFFETLRELRRGQTLTDLGERLAELTQAVVTTGKPGKLTLTLTLAPAGKKSAALVMTDKIALAEPAPDQAQTIFFPTVDYQLSRSDPNQLALRLQSAPSPAAPLPGVDEDGVIIDEDDLNRALAETGDK